MRSILIPLALLIASAPVSAKVVRATDAGFDIRHEALVAATPDAVYAVLIEPRRWWSKAHSWSSDSANLMLDPRRRGPCRSSCPTEAPRRLPAADAWLTGC